MIRKISATVALAALVLLLATAAVFTGSAVFGVPRLQAETQHIEGLPDIGVLAADNLTMRVHGVGGTFSNHEGPKMVESTEDGRVKVTFVEVRYAPAVDFVFYWDGDDLGSFLAPEIKGQRWTYTLEVYISADSSIEVLVGDPVGVYTWCGLSLGYCRPGEAAAYSTPECTAASHDPEYLKLYKPGSGPACIHRHYHKSCNGCPVEVVE